LENNKVNEIAFDFVREENIGDDLLEVKQVY